MKLRLTTLSCAAALCSLPVSAQDAPPPAAPPAPAPAPAPAAPGAPELLPPAQGVPAEVPDGFASEKDRQSYAVGWLFAMREKNTAASAGSAPPKVDEVLAGMSDVFTGAKSADYAVGAMLAMQVRRAEVDVDVAALSAAVTDALAGAAPKLTEQQQQMVLQRVQNDLKNRVQARQKAESEKTLKAATDFMAENGKAEGVVTTPSGLQYKIEKQGEGKAPGENDITTLNYKATLLDGTDFEKPATAGPTRKPIRMLPKGIQEGLAILKTGGKAKFWVPPSLGYGETGRPPFVKANAVLVYDLEFVASEPLPKPPPATPAGTAPGKGPITAVTPPITVEIPPKPGDKPAPPPAPPAPPAPPPAPEK